VRLCSALGESTPMRRPLESHIIGVLTGEGVGEEVVPVALTLLDTLASHTGVTFAIHYGGMIGASALRCHGKCLTEEVEHFCESIFARGGAILCGPGGDRFVYELRAKFDLFCKFTPLKPLPALADVGVIRPECLADIDIVAVRENTGGLYLGQWGLEESAMGGKEAFHRFAYRQATVDRIIRTGAVLASHRSGTLTITTKPGGVPSISALWEERAKHICDEVGINLRVLEIDNAVYQLIANARSFDVVVSPNMLGDVLADCGALLLGSRGLSYSGNFAHCGKAVYQTGHGAAYDIAGSDSANPVGQILSLAMMLRESFALHNLAAAIVSATDMTLAQGFRTADIASPDSHVVGTRELGERIGQALATILETPRAQVCAPA
jgi:3-isopropylmalate dehydrogenase